MRPLRYPDGTLVSSAYLRQTIDADGNATITVKEYGSGKAWVVATENSAPVGGDIKAEFEVGR